MTLNAGMKLGPYEIVEPLGAGGMGEVYRARDTKLNRDVAIKVLPEAFAADRERLARFEREARVLASLNHPSIAAIHGLEDSGTTHALVMELVEGPTLAEKIAADSADFTDEKLKIARQIAEALEFAHEKGIIHRDLKPANIKITPDGQVKLLDFGLAKALEPTQDPKAKTQDIPGPKTQDPALAEALSQSPTLTMGATHAGVILGTAAYMAPEQARGKDVDRRADIWAFGVVLYEMLAGRRPFQGEDASETLAAVIKDEPDWTAIPAGTPPAIVRLLRRCLTKDPKQRLQAIGDARIPIAEILSGSSPDLDGPVTGHIQSNRPRIAMWVLACVPILILALFLAIWPPWRRTAPKATSLRLGIDLGTDLRITGNLQNLALSPDGSLLAFMGAGNSSNSTPGQLYVRRLDQLKAVPLKGIENARSPFFSPDGQWIAFFSRSDAKWERVSVNGGAAQPLLESTYSSLGQYPGSWTDDGIVVSMNEGIVRASQAGGRAELITKPGEFKDQAARWPQLLPGGKALLFTDFTGSLENPDKANIKVKTLPDGPSRIVVPGGYQGRYLPSGHLVYIYQGMLYAVPFSADRLEPMGTAVPVVEEGIWGYSNRARVAFSDSGMMVYQPGSIISLIDIPTVTIDWLESSGRREQLYPDPGKYADPRFSPDGKRLALTRRGSGESGIWVLDLANSRMQRLTEGAQDQCPLWAPDGRHIAFFGRDSTKDLSFLGWVRADGSSAVHRILEDRMMAGSIPRSFSLNGDRLVYQVWGATTYGDIWTVALDMNDPEHPKPGKPEAILNSPNHEAWATFSPDGKWLAYDCQELGKSEVYVMPFPATGARHQISTGGGVDAIWSRKAPELFYSNNANQIMVVSYEIRDQAFLPGKPRLWSESKVIPGQLGAMGRLDLAPDGRRFAVITPLKTEESAGSSNLVLVTNFFDELRRRVPVKSGQ